jgi:uncharacterized repeat protein (TIGR01451 family)
VNEGPEDRATTGETVRYRVVVTNHGPDVASDVTVDARVDLLADADGVPNGSSVKSTQGSCTTTRHSASCLLGTLAVGEVETVTVRAVALSTGPVDSFAKVESDQCAPCDADWATLWIHERELALTNVVSRSMLWAGGTTRYTVRVRNPSESVVRHLIVCDWLPAGFFIVGARPDGDLVYDQYCWNVPRLGAGARRSFSVKVRAPRDAKGRKTIRAVVTSLDAEDAQAKRAIRVIGAR